MIKEITRPQWKDAYPLMNQLRTHLTEKEYMSIMEAAVQENQYQLFGIWENNRLKALVGFMPMTTFYYGRFIWICDLITDSQERSKGYGIDLLGFVEQYAKDHGFAKVALSSGLQRHDAHRFYEEKGTYDKVSYVFKKELKEI
ncbi:GNAT family N-acetyltransferase [Jeotgalibacillus campisalis]|uniref:Acetyltransferase, GNAT family n=1 Tax=Jeotgalibacillus campisalis TaxID=220754 RepID=A0A0C2VJV9_9BACL|nr:acetyltransferase, GNAT family [Jeotgalibacillus campisalis]